MILIDIVYEKSQIRSSIYAPSLSTRISIESVSSFQYLSGIFCISSHSSFSSETCISLILNDISRWGSDSHTTWSKSENMNHSILILSTYHLHDSITSYINCVEFSRTKQMVSSIFLSILSIVIELDILLLALEIHAYSIYSSVLCLQYLSTSPNDALW